MRASTFYPGRIIMVVNARRPLTSTFTSSWLVGFPGTLATQEVFSTKTKIYVWSFFFKSGDEIFDTILAKVKEGLMLTRQWVGLQDAAKRDGFCSLLQHKNEGVDLVDLVAWHSEDNFLGAVRRKDDKNQPKWSVLVLGIFKIRSRLHNYSSRLFELASSENERCSPFDRI